MYNIEERSIKFTNTPSFALLYFLPRGKDTAHIKKMCSCVIQQADICVGIRNSIVTIEVTKTCVRTIIQVTANFFLVPTVMNCAL